MLRIPALADLPWFLPGFAISVVIGYLVRHRAPRFLGASPLLGWVVVVSLGIIASATLTPRESAFEGGAQAAGCDFSRVGLASLKDILELGDTFLNTGRHGPHHRGGADLHPLRTVARGAGGPARRNPCLPADIASG
jgi:hypothetical protein